jgi:K+-sensing histidine kinase KdpD
MKQEKSVLVCVTDQKSCERLIKAGYLLSKTLNLKLKVLSVQPSNQVKNLQETPLEYLFSVCKSLDAEMQVYWGDNVNNVAVDYIRRNRVEQLIFGVPEKMVQGNFVYDVHQAFPNIPISVVDELHVAKSLDFTHRFRTMDM